MSLPVKSVVKKIFRLTRDILVGFLGFLVGSLWFTSTWPRVDGLFGLFLILLAIAGIAKINIRPFSDFSFSETFKIYFPQNLQETGYRHVACACYRFGFILMVIPSMSYPIVENIFNTGARIQYYAVEMAVLLIMGIYFMFRGFFINTIGIVKRYISKSHSKK